MTLTIKDKKIIWTKLYFIQFYNEKIWITGVFLWLKDPDPVFSRIWIRVPKKTGYGSATLVKTKWYFRDHRNSLSIWKSRPMLLSFIFKDFLTPVLRVYCHSMLYLFYDSTVFLALPSSDLSIYNILHINVFLSSYLSIYMFV